MRFNLPAMSTLCAFFGIDDKPSGDLGHASAYLASESYVTYLDGRIKDRESQKVFASLTMPALFGYVGDELVGEVLEKAIRKIDGAEGLFKASLNSEARAHSLLEFFNSSLPEKVALWGGDSIVVYIGKSKDAKARESKFHIWEFTRPPDNEWRLKELRVPATSGPPVGTGFWGSGAHLLFRISGDRLGDYKHYAEFTWAYFRTLFEALRREHDQRSGGSIQLAFLPRGGNGSYIGIIDKDKNKFVCGKPFSKESPEVSRWVDMDFDECNPDTLQKRADRKRSPTVKASRS